MSPFKLSILSGTAAVVITGATLFFIQRARAGEVRLLRASNEQMRKVAYERRQAVHAAGESLVAAGNASGLKPANPPSSVIDAPPQTSSTEAAQNSRYRFQGQATPVDALQSFAWACDRGDTALMQKLITFEATARPKVETYLATLPAEVRAQCPTIEALAAMLLVQDGMHRPFPDADLLSRATVEKVSDDRVRTRMPGTPRDGGLYQRIGTDWKFVITEAAVDEYFAKASRR